MNDCVDYDRETMVLVQTVLKKKERMLLKRRPNDYANEVITVDQTTSGFGDRFIPRRYCFDRNETNKKFSKTYEFKDILSVFSHSVPPYYWMHGAYNRLLDTVLGFESRRLLHFSDSFPFDAVDALGQSYARKAQMSVRDWACKPRSKPCAYPETSHNVDGLVETNSPNLIDWSVNGQICTSMGGDIFIWKRNDDRTMVFGMKEVNALAYCPNGRFLAIAHTPWILADPVLELWDVIVREFYAEIKFKRDLTPYGRATTIAWGRKGKELAVGTERGVVVKFAVPELTVISKSGSYSIPIVFLKYSPDMKYLASADERGLIIIYDRVTLVMQAQVASKRRCNVFLDWHPWSNGDLVLAEGYPASLVIVHVPTKSIVCFYQRTDVTSAITSVSFSKTTGELLVTVAKVGADGFSDHKVLVMSSIVSVVDVLQLQDSGARFMVWSPDGKKIATAGDDEAITIWNFHNVKKVSKAPIIEKLPGGLEAEMGTKFKKWSVIH